MSDVDSNNLVYRRVGKKPNLNSKYLVFWLFIPLLVLDIALGLSARQSQQDNNAFKDQIKDLQVGIWSIESQYKLLRQEILATKIMVKRCGGE